MSFYLEMEMMALSLGVWKWEPRHWSQGSLLLSALLSSLDSLPHMQPRTHKHVHTHGHMHTHTSDKVEVTYKVNVTFSI